MWIIPLILFLLFAISVLVQSIPKKKPPFVDLQSYNYVKAEQSAEYKRFMPDKYRAIKRLERETITKVDRSYHKARRKNRRLKMEEYLKENPELLEPLLNDKVNYMMEFLKDDINCYIEAKMKDEAFLKENMIKLYEEKLGNELIRKINAHNNDDYMFQLQQQLFQQQVQLQNDLMQQQLHQQMHEQMHQQMHEQMQQQMQEQMQHQMQMQMQQQMQDQMQQQMQQNMNQMNNMHTGF